MIVAFCEYGNEESLQQLRMDLSRALGLHHSALQLRSIETLPRTASGKVDYASLERQIR
jgi:acyl-coenzyme A synthetase/AMP-(fatty) acid ligase